MPFWIEHFVYKKKLLDISYTVPLNGDLPSPKDDIDQIDNPDECVLFCSRYLQHRSIQNRDFNWLPNDIWMSRKKGVGAIIFKLFIFEGSFFILMVVIWLPLEIFKCNKIIQKHFSFFATTFVRHWRRNKPLVKILLLFLILLQTLMYMDSGYW